MDVSDGDLVFPPLGFAGGGERKEIETSAVVNLGPGGWSHLCFCSRTMPRQVSMKLLCVSTRKSVRAVVHAPAPTVVGMRYSREVSRVIEGSRCLSSTLRRAVLCDGEREGGGGRGREGGEECEEKGCKCMGAVFYHGPSACLPPAPRLSADSPPSLGTPYEHSLHKTKL